jgi:hypothetical protein
MNARPLFWLVLTALIVPIRGFAQPLQEQLPPFSSVVGNLSAGGTDTWIFTGLDGEVASFLVETTSTLDPSITIVTETGAVLVSQDDYDYPNTRDALIQSLTIPFTGTYTIQVTGYANTSGSYRLTRLRGYGDGADLNGFTDGGSWTSSNNEVDIALDVSNGILGLGLSGIGQEAFAISQNRQRLTDYYVQVGADVQVGRGGWIVHLVHHQQRNDSFHLLSLNDRGSWRYAIRTGDSETVLRDWGGHPAIVQGATEFELGVLANQGVFEVFYNGSPLGRFVNTTLEGGVIGLGVTTVDTLDAEVAVQFTNLRITTPILNAEGTDPIPSQVIISDPLEMAQSIERQRMIAPGGEMTLNVPESSLQSLDPGVSRLQLGRGVTFTNFALSTEVSIRAASPEGINGCGIFFRGVDDTQYIVAYIDQTGGYGLAQRQGDGFLPGLFGVRPQLGTSEHHLLVTVDDTKIHYYVDGVYAGSIEAPATAGNIGNAVINYDSNTTACSYQNTWLWTWDNASENP